ncbi:MAG: chaperone modulator CbpM [Desulfovibrio sp.]|uniref:chaperone modulator CbpM n=1 Tax=Desulfovibrio sp. 7SRBS1 TaxID=3378064 RepID=UPI003B3F5172
MFVKRGETLPTRSKMLSWNQMMEITGMGRTKVMEILEIGWIEPAKTNEQEYLFRLEDVYRMKKLNRICADLEVTTVGGSIIVDLLERIERLEQQVEELSRR